LETQGRQRPTALVTGASGGIGAELARVLAREGHDLVLVARSREPLEALAREVRDRFGAAARAIPADLQAPGAAREVHARATADGAEVDVLVNNAGFGLHGPFVELDAAEQTAMIQLNVVALTELTRAFAPEMVRRRRGRILMLGSTAAFQPGPHMAVYCATKAYVLSLSEALAQELRGSGVTVTCVCPGATETGFAARAGNGDTRLFRAGTMSPRAVAETAWRALARGRALVVPGVRNRVMAASTRLVPISAAARVAGVFLGKPAR
jgi:short-subunit dehydrogenase